MKSEKFREPEDTVITVILCHFFELANRTQPTYIHDHLLIALIAHVVVAACLEFAH